MKRTQWIALIWAILGLISMIEYSITKNKIESVKGILCAGIASVISCIRISKSES